MTMTLDSRHLTLEPTDRLEVITDTRALVMMIYSQQYPQSEKFGMESQIRRAVTSILLNLVEGNEFNDGSRTQHFRRALGSIKEVEECYRISILLKFFENREDIWEQIDKCAKKLNRLIITVSRVESRGSY